MLNYSVFSYSAATTLVSLVDQQVAPPPLCSAVALSLGTNRGAPVMGAVVEGVHATIGSQIATAMARDAILTEAFVAFGIESETSSLELVRAVFSESNSQVYAYAHRMAAGGQVSAKGVVAVLDGTQVTIGQAGEYDSFLYRSKKVVPFFERGTPSERSRGGVLERFIGANAKILVDLATVTVEEGDIIIITTLPLGASAERTVREALMSSSGLNEACREIGRRGAGAVKEQGMVDDPAFFKHLAVFMWEIGAPAIT